MKFAERGLITLGFHQIAACGTEATVRFEVEDQGIWISPEMQARVFQWFELCDNTSTRRYEGTGLGLTLSKPLVLLMTGDMGVSSTPGQGSTIWFSVPQPFSEAPSLSLLLQDGVRVCRIGPSSSADPWLSPRSPDMHPVEVRRDCRSQDIEVIKMGCNSIRCAVLLVILSCSSVCAQQSLTSNVDLSGSIGRIVRVDTVGGGTFQGRLLKTEEDRIELLNADGLILQISRSEIKSALEIKPQGGVNPYFQDASSNRLIVIPTGFGMEEKEFHIADLEIIGVTASYGVSRHFSAWAGVSIPGFVVNARFSFSIANDFIGTSVGSFAALSWAPMTDSGMAGQGLFIPYLITSFGSENENLTIGAGCVVTFNNSAPSDFLGFGALVAVLGGKLPLSSTTALITENWVIVPHYQTSPGDSAIVMVLPAVVFRIAGNRLSWDIGATYPFEVYSAGVRSTLGFPLPILTLTYRIG